MDIINKLKTGTLSGIIGSGANLLTGLINAFRQKKNINLQNQANMKLSNYAYNQELAAWNRQNEYNSPASQMARFKAAGLNPNLIYTQGNPGNAVFIPKYQAPQLAFDYKPAFNPEGILRSYNEGYKSYYNRTNFQTQREILLNQLNSLKAKVADQINQLDLDWDKGTKEKLANLIIGQVEGNIARTQSQKKIIDQQIELNDFSKEYFDKGGKYFQPILNLLRILVGKGIDLNN